MFVVAAVSSSRKLIQLKQLLRKSDTLSRILFISISFFWHNLSSFFPFLVLQKKLQDIFSFTLSLSFVVCEMRACERGKKDYWFLMTLLAFSSHAYQMEHSLLPVVEQCTQTLFHAVQFVYSFLQKLMKATSGYRKAKLDGKGIIKYSIDTIMTTKSRFLRC